MFRTQNHQKEEGDSLSFSFDLIGPLLHSQIPFLAVERERRRHHSYTARHSTKKRGERAGERQPRSYQKTILTCGRGLKVGQTHSLLSRGTFFQASISTHQIQNHLRTQRDKILVLMQNKTWYGEVSRLGWREVERRREG